MITSLFLFAGLAFADPKEQLQEASLKMEAATKKQCDCRFDFSSQIETRSSLDKICDAKIKPQTANLDAAKILQLYQKIHAAYVQFLSNSKELSAEQKEALLQRLQKIPQPEIKFCDPMDISYDNLENKISGCISKDQSLLQLGLILSHELGHAIGPCAYHASWSPFKLTKMGNTLSYSKPMDYKSSLNEYPFKKMLSCQPDEITKLQLTNQVRNEAWNVMCARTKQEELFADLIGSSVYADVLKAQGGIESEQFLELAKTLCPSKGPVREVRIENGQSKVTERIDWLEPAGYPQTDIRLTALYQAFSHKTVISPKKDLFFNPSTSLKGCFQ